MERDLKAYFAEVNDIHDRIAQVVGIGAEGTWHAGEVRWDLLRVDQVLDVPGLGQVVVVDLHDALDDFYDWSQPVYLVLNVGDRHFRVTGKNVSHNGTSWEYAAFTEVKGTIEARRSWKYADR